MRARCASDRRWIGGSSVGGSSGAAVPKGTCLRLSRSNATWRAITEKDKECLRRLADASASLWNKLTYERRQDYFSDGDVWVTAEYQGHSNGVVGSATVQQVTRKNREAWRSFLPLRRTARTPTRTTEDE